MNTQNPNPNHELDLNAQSTETVIQGDKKLTMIYVMISR